MDISTQDSSSSEERSDDGGSSSVESHARRLGYASRTCSSEEEVDFASHPWQSPMVSDDEVAATQVLKIWSPASSQDCIVIDDDSSDHEPPVKKKKLTRQDAELNQKLRCHEIMPTPLDAVLLPSDPAVVGGGDEPYYNHVDPNIPRKTNFRFQGKFLFCTWPQNAMTKEAVMANLRMLPNAEFGVVCTEDHKDQVGVHLHAFVAFSEKINKAGYDWLDSLAGKKHGDYAPARNNLNAVRYVIKDGNFCSFGFNPKEYVSNLEKGKKGKGPTKQSLMAQAILDGAGMDELNVLDPGWVMMNKRKAEEYMAWCLMKKAQESLVPLPPFPALSLTPWDEVIRTWIAKNVEQVRPFKAKQLYIWSDGPDVGKTNLVEVLDKSLLTYHLPKDKFVDGYESNRFKLVVCDEFNAQFTIQFLNEFLQGSKMHLNQKGSGTLKTDNPPCIFLSNKSLEDCYCKANSTGSFRALKARFIEVEVPVGSKIDLWHTWKKV